MCFVKHLSSKRKDKKVGGECREKVGPLQTNTMASLVTDTCPHVWVDGWLLEIMEEQCMQPNSSTIKMGGVSGLVVMTWTLHSSSNSCTPLF